MQKAGVPLFLACFNLVKTRACSAQLHYLRAPQSGVRAEILGQGYGSSSYHTPTCTCHQGFWLGVCNHNTKPENLFVLATTAMRAMLSMPKPYYTKSLDEKWLANGKPCCKTLKNQDSSGCSIHATYRSRLSLRSSKSGRLYGIRVKNP